MISHGKEWSLIPTLLLALVPGTVRAHRAECSAAVPRVLQHPSLSIYGICYPPVDDTVDLVPAKYSPWTHVPICDVSASDPDRKFCVYSNSRHGKRGLSVLSRPEVASDNIGILDEFLNFTQNDGPFKIVDIPNKGKGVVATRHIKRYETIMADYAALLIDVAFAAEVPAENGYQLLQKAVDQLADPESVLALDQSNELAQNPIENVLRTNAFHSMLGEDAHMALYPLVSRINHACKPNAFTRFDPKSLQLVSVGAAKDILPGEEITISYITLGKPTPERKKALKLWGFECQCSLCTAPPSEQAQSDARREQIETLREQAISAFQAGRVYQSMRITRQIINLIPTEELFPMYAEQYENMARIYFVLRDQEKAVKWARMSLEVLVEQGYIERVRPEHFQIMWRRFTEEEGGRF